MRAARIFHCQPEGIELTLFAAEGGAVGVDAGERDGWSGDLGPLEGDGVAIGMEGSRAIQQNITGRDADLVGAGVGHWSGKAGAHGTRQSLIANPRNVHGHRAFVSLELLGPQLIAEQDAAHDAAVLIAREQCFVHAAFER